MFAGLCFYTTSNSPVFKIDIERAANISREYLEDKGPVTKVLYEVAQEAPDFIMNMVIAGATAGTGTAVTEGVKTGAKTSIKQLAKNIVKKAALSPDVIPMSIKIFANSYQDTLAKTGDEKKALAVGLLDAYIEGLIEKGGVQSLIKEGGSGLTRFLKGIGEEVLEEWLQDPVNPALQKTVGGVSDIPWYSYKGEGVIDPGRMLETVAPTAILSILGGGAANIIQNVAVRKAIGDIQNAVEQNIISEKEAQDIIKELENLEAPTAETTQVTETQQAVETVPVQTEQTASPEGVVSETTTETPSILAQDETKTETGQTILPSTEKTITDENRRGAIQEAQEAEQQKTVTKPIDKALQAKRNKTLDQHVNYDGQVMTRRQFIEQAVEGGLRIEEAEVTDTAKKKRLEAELKELKKKVIPGLSNPNLPEVKRINAIQEELAKGVTKPEYRVYNPDGSFKTISKTEYDYAIELLNKRNSEEIGEKELNTVKITNNNLGKTTKAYDNDNKEYQFQYAVVSADDLITSHDTNLHANPEYPQELQPRARERAASRIQIDRIAYNVQPEKLGDSADISVGAPIVGNDNIVESGNARVIGLKKMYQASQKNAEKYINWLRENADKFGIDPNNLPDKPVLVRIRQSDVDRVEFARKANEASVAAMSSSETAKMDADRLTDRILGLFVPSEDGNINTATNRPFIHAFVQEVIPKNEIGKYITSNGFLSQDGLTRVRNAIFNKAYDSDTLLARIAEATDDNIKKVTNTLINIAPKVVSIKQGIKNGVLHDLDFSKDIADAVEKYINLKDSGMQIDEYLNQFTLFDDGVSQEAKYLLGVIDQYGAGRRGSTKKLTEYFNEVFNNIEALGHPDQLTLTGELKDVNKMDVLKDAYRRLEEGYGQVDFESFIQIRPEERTTGEGIIGQKESRVGEGQGQKEKVSAFSGTAVALPEGTKTATYSKTMDDLIQIIEDFTGVPIRTGKFRQKALGIFKENAEVIRTKVRGDLPVITHELGHYFDKKHKFYGNATFDNELMPLGLRTSKPSYSKKDIRKEGIAEFLRLYLTDNIRAKHVAPKFMEYFENTIDSDELNFLSQLRTDITAVVNLKPENRVYNSVSSYESRKTNARKAPLFQRLMNQWIDKDAIVARIQKEAEAKGYEGPNLYTAFENLRGLDAQIENMVMDGQRDLEGNIIFKSMREILEPISKKRCKELGLDPEQVRKDFVAYMVSRRAMDYKDRGLAMPDQWSVYADTVSRMESKYGELFINVFNDIRTWEDNSLQWLVVSGIKTQEEIEAIKFANANHIPLQRIRDTVELIRTGSGKSIGQSKQVLKRAIGGGETIIDPIESIITNAFIIYRAAKSNDVLRMLKSITEIEGMGKWIEAVPDKTKSKSFSVEDVRTQLMKLAKEYENDVLLEALENMSDEELESSVSIFYTMPIEGDNEITIYENGKGQLYEVDTELYKAIKGLSRQQSHWLIKIFNIPKRIQQFGAVTTIEFMIRNINRDFMTSAIQSEVGINPIELMKGYFEAFRRGDAYNELVAMGGATEFFNINSRREAQKLEDKALGYGFAEKFGRLRENIMELAKNNNARTRRKVVDAFVALTSEIPDAIRSLVDWSEMGPRIAEYQKALKKGYTKEEATSLSRKVTQDFARHGYLGREYNKIAAFFNANIQGTARLIETFKKHPVRTMFRGFMYITLPTMLLYYINYDDEDYQNLPDWRKALFWNIPIGDGKFVSIPRPYGYSFIFGALPEIVLDRMLIDDNKTFERIKEAFINNFDVPIEPSASKGIIDVLRNKQWNQSPIEGTWDRKNYPAYLIRNEKTSKIATALGDFFKNEKGLSPKQIDYLIKSYFGSVGEYLWRIPDKIEEGITITRDIKEYPVIKAFITDSVYSTDVINDLYEYNEELTRRIKEYNETGQFRYVKDKTGKELERLIVDLDELRKESNRVIMKLSDERLAIKEIQDDPQLSREIKESKAREIRYWMNKEAEAFNKKYEQFKKQHGIK